MTITNNYPKINRNLKITLNVEYFKCVYLYFMSEMEFIEIIYNIAIHQFTKYPIL